MAKKVKKGGGTASRGRKTKKYGNRTGLFVILGVVAIALIGFLGYIFGPKTDWVDGKTMDEYVKEDIPLEEALPEKFDSYIDFSDGMQYAYVDQSIKNNLQGVVNKLTKNSEFFSLANGEITPMGKMESTKIYNQIIDADSYSLQSAPLEKALDSIVKNGRPAFMVTDFEEYNGGRIQQENYAKDYFIKWLNEGNDITFYIMNFNENGKNKHLYFVVFDGKEHKLLKEIEDALAGRDSNIVRYTLSNNNFPMARDYGKLVKNHRGGNYHAKNGEDAVTVVDERGGADSFRIFDGYLAEYYPSNAGSWENILKNASALSPDALAEISDENPFKYVVSGRFVDLSKNNGYTIDRLGLSVKDVSGRYRKFANIEGGESDEESVVTDFLMLDNPDVKDAKAHEIRVKFDPKFKGTFPSKIDPNALFRADVYVEKATPNIGSNLSNLFEWDGNRSLVESVRNTLQSSNPEGTRLFTIYFHLNK